MKKKTLALLGLVLSLTAGAVATIPRADAAACPFRDLICTDNYDPVICLDGKVYSNACYAMRACAVGCRPYQPAS